MLKQLPLVLALGLLLIQAFAELAAMWRTGSLKRQRTPEWTFYAVNVPYRLMFAAGILERYFQPIIVPWPLLVGGSVLMTAGIALRVICHHYLGFFFSPFVELDEEHRLTEKGCYRYLRHPMYLGTLLILIGTPMMTASWWAALFSLLAAVGLVARLKKEEHYMQQNLDGFSEYARRTWMLIPGIW